MVDLALACDPRTIELLRQHPRIKAVEEDGETGLRFICGDWRRTIRVGDTRAPIYGLVETIDNNPLVCADVISIPSPTSTLALIGLAPLATAAILSDSPMMIVNAETDPNEIDEALTLMGANVSVGVHVESMDLDGVLAATIMIAVNSEIGIAEICDLYRERYERSFYIREFAGDTWQPELVRRTPFAAYRLAMADDYPESLLTVRVLADLSGKAGAAQAVHAMNVMCGFEESLGI